MHSYPEGSDDGLLVANPVIRFAFVEYEDRRDADDAYHDMHNKRIGRDDILKIEVSYLRIAVAVGQGPCADVSTVGSYSSFCILALRFWP